MNKKELNIIAISNSSTHVGSYIAILAEIDGDKKLPIVMKQSESNTLFLEMEGIKTKRTNIYNFIKNMLDNFKINISSIFIHDFKEDIFKTSVILNNGSEDVEIDITINDALILSKLYNCSIYIDSDVLNKYGISSNAKNLNGIQKLEKLLEAALLNEEYEIAAGIRDRIQSLLDE